MVFYFIGLGLYDEKDITVRGLEVVKSCEKVYLEAYTSVLTVPVERLEAFYGKTVTVCDRDKVESGCDEMIEEARTQNVCMLVVGDVFGATTHTDLATRCINADVPYECIFNASIMNAVGACGLQLYNFGQAVSIVFFTDTWRPESFYDKLLVNHAHGFHSLCLMDIRIKERTVENIVMNRAIYEPPRFMTIRQCIEQLLWIEARRKGGICTPASRAVGCARIGHPDQRIVSGTLAELARVDFGKELHSLVLVGTTHEIDEEMLRARAAKDKDFVFPEVPFPPPGALESLAAEEAEEAEGDYSQESYEPEQRKHD